MTDVTIVIVLNRISTLIGIFFGIALRYVYFSFFFMHSLKTGLNADKTFLSLNRFANEVYTLYNPLNASRLALFRKNMKTCASVKRNAEIFCNF